MILTDLFYCEGTDYFLRVSGLVVFWFLFPVRSIDNKPYSSGTGWWYWKSREKHIFSPPSLWDVCVPVHPCSSLSVTTAFSLLKFIFSATENSCIRTSQASNGMRDFCAQEVFCGFPLERKCEGSREADSSHGTGGLSVDIASKSRYTCTFKGSPKEHSSLVTACWASLHPGCSRVSLQFMQKDMQGKY